MILDKLQDKAIKILIKKIKAIDNELDSNPVGELIALRKQFSDLLKKYPEDHYKQKEVKDFLDSAVKKEERLKKQIDKITNGGYYLGLLDKKTEYESELADLQREQIFRGIRANR